MPVAVRPLRFVHRGKIVEIVDLDPNLTVLNYLRAAPPLGAGSIGTKEGCASGDCGACAVVVAELESTDSTVPQPPKLRFRAINSCIRSLSSLETCALWTCEDIAPDAAAQLLHPVQQAMVDMHASQCGFCTPGFVMSLFALYSQRAADHAAVHAADYSEASAASGVRDPVAAAVALAAVEPLDRDAVLHALSGNLCRCTGYRPIVDAGLRACAQTHGEHVPVWVATQRQQTVQLLKSITPAKGGRLVAGRGSLRATSYRPRTLTELLALRAAHPDAQLIAGSTDVGVWQNKLHKRYEKTIDVTSVDELRQVRHDQHALTIGAAARLTEAFAAMVELWPSLRVFTERFAGLTIRNSATLGGNIANGSPIGDSMPLLIALGARLRLLSADSERLLAIEEFFVGFRKTALASNEIIGDIVIPKPQGRHFVRAYKVSKRFEDDISTVSLAIALEFGGNDATESGQGRSVGIVKSVRIGAGGVATIPASALQTESVLVGQPWSLAAVTKAATILRDEFTPIDDLRGSAAYRRQVLGNLLLRCWHESQGNPLSLDTMQPSQIMALFP